MNITINFYHVLKISIRYTLQKSTASNLKLRWPCKETSLNRKREFKSMVSFLNIFNILSSFTLMMLYTVFLSWGHFAFSALNCIVSFEEISINISTSLFFNMEESFSSPEPGVFCGSPCMRRSRFAGKTVKVIWCAKNSTFELKKETFWKGDFFFFVLLFCDVSWQIIWHFDDNLLCNSEYQCQYLGTVKLFAVTKQKFCFKSGLFYCG